MSDESNRPIIFLAFANDRDDRVRYLRNLPEEARRLQATLQKAQDDGLCQLILRQNATVDDILDVFQHANYRNRIAVWHYGGHASSYELLFETAGGQAAPVDASAFARFLGQQTGLEMVFLNGCSTQDQVQGLLDAGVSAVIATSQAIDDGVATEFAGRFYRGMAGGATVDTAFKEAGAAVQTTRGRTRDGSTRHLYPAAAQASFVADRLPWDLYLREGAEAAAEWSLPEAAGNPLFGLPPLPELDLPDSPYRHLRWYRREDAEVFFGRATEIRDLYERVTAPRGAPILLFYGQSGVGKSSLLAAGLLPRLEGSHAIRYERRDQSKGLPGTLAQALGSGEVGDLAAAWRAIETAEARPLIVVLDQLEECFTRPNPQQPTELADLLAALQAAFAEPDHRPQGRLILGFRKEWLAEIDGQMSQHRLPRTHVFLQRLDRRGIVEVVTGPTRTGRLRDHYGLTVSGDLPGLIADDLLADRGSAVAPTLQILLSKMWARARRQDYGQPLFDQSLYDDLRAQGLGLGDFLDQQLDVLHSVQPEPVDSGLALDLLAFHTTPLGTAEQRAMADLQQSYRHREEILPGLVQECQDLYLLVDPARDQPDRPPASRLAHDTLAPVVRQHFDESDRPGQRARRILESRAVDWEEGAQGIPLDDADLKVVEAGQSGMRAWDATETRLVAVSRTERDSRRRRSRLLRGALLALGVLIVVAGAVAVWQAVAATEARNVAQARQLAASAIAQLPSDPELSLLLASESAAVGYTTQGEEALRQSLLQTHAYGDLTAKAPSSLTGTASARPREVHFSPDNRYVLGVFDCLDVIWRIEPRALIAEMDLTHFVQDESGYGWSCSPSNVAAFSPSGRLILSSYTDGARGYASEVWETASGHRIAAFEPAGDVYGAAFSHDEEFVVTAEGTYAGAGWGMARVWRISTGELVRQLQDPARERIEGASFSPDDRWLLTMGSRGTARVWDWREGISLSAFNWYLWSKPVFSPDGQWVLAQEDEATAYLVNPTSGTTAATFDHGGEIRNAQFSPDGRYVITSGGPAARVWQAATGEAVATIQGLSAEPQVIGFSPDSRYILTIEGKLAQVWDAETGELVSLLAGHSDVVNSAAFSHDSRFVVTAGQDQVARVWAAGSGALLAELRGHTSGIFGAAFSGDDQWLLTVSFDGSVRLWDARTINPVSELVGHGGLGTISPDSEYIVTVASYGARVWELATGRIVRDLEGTLDISSAGFSPYGRLVALQGVSRRDRTSQIVEAQTGRDVAALGGIIYLVDDAALSTDGRLASIRGGAWPNGSGKVLYTWDLDTGARLTTRLPRDADAYVDSDGQWVAGATGIWNVETGTRVADARCPRCVFSPDRSTLFSSVGPALWNARTWQKVADLTGHAGNIRTARYSHNAAFLVTSARDDSVALVWDASTGERTAALPHDAPVSDASFSAGDDLIVTACEDGIARIWEASTGRLLRELDVPAGAIHTVAFSADDAFLATASSGGEAQVWTTATWTRTISVTGSGPVFSPDGRLLISWDRADALVWDAQTGDLLFTWELVRPWSGLLSGENRPRFSTDGRFVAFDAAATGSNAYRVGNIYRVWNTETGSERTRGDDPIIAVNMDRAQALLLNAAGEPEVWNFATDAPGQILGGEALKPVFSPDSARVATVGGNTARVWDATTGQPLATLRGHTDAVNSVQFAPDGLALVTASADHTARTWDATTGQTLHELRGHVAPVTGAEFSPDGATIITASDDGTLRVWRADTGVEIQTLRYADPPATPDPSFTVNVSDELGEIPPLPRVVAALSPDGAYVATLDGASLSVWDLDSGEAVATFAHDGRRAPGFSPDSRWLAIGDADSTWVIETASGRRIAQLPISGNNVQFAPDGRSLVVNASVFPLARFLPYADLLETAATRASRRLTCEERRIYLDEEDPCTVGSTIEARLEEGRELALGGDVVAAAAKFEEALALDSTLWIEPEREARRLAVDALLFEGQRLARQGDIAGAVAQYSQALQLDPALRIDPQKAARGHALRASIEGLVEEASSEDNAGVDAQLQAALAQADPPPDLPADMWDNLCWYGALYGQAGRVADGACEVAIALADVDIFRRSRGLARARAGDVEGAIADLQVYMSSHEWDYELDEILERLENGEDPDAIFDTETLERLRRE